MVNVGEPTSLGQDGFSDKQSILTNSQTAVDNRWHATIRYSLRQFEAFVTVAELLSFSASADRLGMTAQAVSQLIAEFETQLGFRLFDRTTRRVMLSSAGRDFLASAESVLRHVNFADSAAHDVRNRATGVVRIGAPLVLACTAVIHDYTLERPKVVVRIHDVAVEGLVDAVARGDVELAVGPDRTTGPAVQGDPMFDSPWVLWCAASHPLARRRAVRWDQLRDHPLVAAGHDHESSVSLMRLNAPAGARITPMHVVDNFSTAMGIAARGIAATLAPAYVGALARPFGLVMKRVIEPEVIRKVCLYRSRTRELSPAAEGFAAHLADWLPRWGRRMNSTRSLSAPAWRDE